ncbi:MAG: FAD-binding oxidoreductase [Desulfobacterales bacterium]|nr:FAD-binding oxidoreductase [Desulfobacterales bacterium]
MGKYTVDEVTRMLAEIVGDAAVSHGDTTGVADEGKDIPSTHGRFLCMVRPKDAGEVRSVITLANQKGLNLVPISSGPPHEKGGAMPEVDGVGLDLSGMDGIIRMDRRNRVCIIQPGVTFNQLQEKACRERMRVLLPLLPRPEKSIIGSYLDREPITAPKYHWDTTDPLLCTEVVFGTGDIFRTGSAAGPGSLADQWALGSAQKNPMGPAATDIVKLVQGAQGTMGIVTWASIKLELKPKIHNHYFIQVSTIDDLADFMYEVPKKLLCDNLLVLNSFSLACILEEKANGISILADKQAPFTLIYSVSGNHDYLPEKKVAYQEKAIAAIAQRCGLSILKEVPGASSGSIAQILELPCTGKFWKHRLKGAHQDVFFLTTLDQVQSFILIMGEIVVEFNYPSQEMGIYVQPVQRGRSCHITFSFFYNPLDGDEADNIMHMVRKASKRLAEAGAFFSRPYEPWVDFSYDRCPDSVNALKIVKDIFDPNDILNKGKLCFNGREQDGN